MIDLQTAEDRHEQEWDAFVDAHEASGPYHRFAWKKAVERAYGHKTYYLVARAEGGGIRGVLPLVHVTPPFLRGTLVSLPFCDYGGALTTEPDAAEPLLTEAITLSRSLRAPLMIRSRHPEPLIMERHDWVDSTNKTLMVLNLPEASEILFQGFKAKLRSQIRRPEKEGLTFRLGNMDLVPDFYSVFRTNMRDLGSPVHSRQWIEAVIRGFGDLSRVCVVYAGDRPVAGGILLCQGKTATVPWASSLREYARSSPNMLLYWVFLEYAADHGFERFDFGRSSPGEGTYRFKEQWGALPHPLHWFSREKARRGKSHLKPEVFRAAIEKTWARLPPCITDSLGPLLRKYVSL